MYPDTGRYYAPKGMSYTRIQISLCHYQVHVNREQFFKHADSEENLCGPQACRPLLLAEAQSRANAKRTR